MTIVNVLQASPCELPQALLAAQEAIHLPEVQAILRRLSEYNLGVFMPHMHDARTGEFMTLPDEVIQVESGMEVSFRPATELADQTSRFIPVGWIWRAGTSTPTTVCEMVSEECAGAKELSTKHKMKSTNGAAG